MKQIRTEDAVGHVICHDITRIIKDKEKGVAFKKGHIVQPEDIPELLAIGKEHLYVWEKTEHMLHEDEAAQILAAACQNEHMRISEPKEGKIEIFTEQDGLFVVDTKRLLDINTMEHMMIATRSSMQYVKAGDKLAGTRIIPLVIEKEKMEQVAAVANESNPILEVKPMVRKRVGVVTTGGEVYHGRIQDTFTPVIEEKLKSYGAAMELHTLVPDEKERIIEAIREMKEAGMDLIVCTGGMSVDPDDLTPAAIRDSGASIITYGAPVLPGAMFLLGYFPDGTPIMGLPGCVMYAKATIFDMMLPRVLADVPVSRRDIVALGNGGLCLGCPVCHYPNCAYGVTV
jgi:molybdenum cofactor synthesis domain-containing protein